MILRRTRAKALLASLLALGLGACQDQVTSPELEPEVVDPEMGLFGSLRNRTAFTLTILHNNDGESELLPDDKGFGGVARFATVLEDLKRQATEGCRDFRFPIDRGAPFCDVVLVSSGDNFLAGPRFNASLEKGVPFYDGIAMDQVGYDAIAIGNHEFDFGPDVLADFIDSFSENPAPFLSANLDVSGEPGLAALEAQGRIASSTIVRLKGARVGIIGATTPDLPFISSPRNVEVREDVAAAVMREVFRLRIRGINKIVLISHLQSLTEDLDLIPLLDQVDVVVAGGGDELLANDPDNLIDGDVPAGPYPEKAFDRDGTEVPVITTSGGYRYVGRLVVEFNALGQVLKIGKISGPVPVEGEPDPILLAEVEDEVAASVAALDANIVGTSQVALEGRRDPGIRTEETNLGNLVADALLWQARELAPVFGVPTPDVGLQNGGGIRNNNLIPAGNITELTTFDILPFPNFVTVVPSVPRDQFKEILENAVSRVESVSGRFAQVAGFSFDYTLAGTPQELDDDGNVTVPGSRVLNVTLDDGTPIVVGGAVQDGDPLTIATIDFLAKSGDQYPYRGASFTTLGVTYQQALEDYIQSPVSVGGLGGLISAADYPEGGSGRILQVSGP